MERKPTGRLPWTTVFCAIFVALFYLYLWRVIDTRILYEASPRFPVFFTGQQFLHESMSRYAGPLDYVAGLVAQSYYYAWLGALAISLLTALICLALDAVVRSIASRTRFFSLLPAIVVLIAYNRCFPHVAFLVGPLAALGAAVLYVRLPAQRNVFRIAGFVGIASLLCYATGATYALFVVIVATHELAVKRRGLVALGALLSAGAIPYLVGTCVFQLDVASAFTHPRPYDPDASGRAAPVLAALYASIPAAVICAGIWRVLAMRRERRIAESPAEGRTTAPIRSPKGRLPRLRRVATHPAFAWLLFLAGTSGVAFCTYDHFGWTILRMGYGARHGRWEEVLRLAREIPVEDCNPIVGQHLNEALYHTGRLPYEMFRYPQRADGLLFDMTLSQTAGEQNDRLHAVRDLYYQIGDIDLQLGLVNEAERESHEALAVLGQHGTVLYRLALINIVKKQPGAALAYLMALRRHLIYGREADDLMRRLATDPLLSSDPEVQRIRSIMLHRDQTGPDLSGERDYLALLQANPHNRMAFEYLMAFYLLRGNLGEFAANLPRLRDFDYPDIPRHYQEAILVYETDTSRRADRCGREISDEVLQQFAEFTRELEFSLNTGAPSRALTRNYGNTYFHYYVTGRSGLGHSQGAPRDGPDSGTPSP